MGAADQGVEADEARRTSERRSLTPVFDGQSGSATHGGNRGHRLGQG
jgi:hypothetical protein